MLFVTPVLSPGPCPLEVERPYSVHDAPALWWWCFWLRAALPDGHLSGWWWLQGFLLDFQPFLDGKPPLPVMLPKSIAQASKGAQ